MSGEYADMEIDRGLDQDYPFGMRSCYSRSWKRMPSTPVKKQKFKMPESVGDDSFTQWWDHELNLVGSESLYEIAMLAWNEALKRVEKAL
jgi:hypothetical protein